MICELCEIEIPDRFLQPMFVNGMYINVDPECALALTNKIHGTNRSEFKGQMAQQLLEDFRDWVYENDKS